MPDTNAQENESQDGVSIKVRVGDVGKCTPFYGHIKYSGIKYKGKGAFLVL